MVGSLTAWLKENSDWLVPATGLVQLVAILIAAWTIRLTQAQRSVTESINLVTTFDRLLTEWSDECSTPTMGNIGRDRELALCVGRLCGQYEIVAEALNRRLFAPMTSRLMRGYVSDGLSVMSLHHRTCEAVRANAQNREVYNATKAFLLKNFEFTFRRDQARAIRMFFPDGAPVLFERSLRGRVSRALKRLELRLGIA